MELWSKSSRMIAEPSAEAGSPVIGILVASIAAVTFWATALGIISLLN